MAEGLDLPFDLLGLESVVLCNQDFQTTPPAGVSSTWGNRMVTCVPLSSAKDTVPCRLWVTIVWTMVIPRPSVCLAGPRPIPSSCTVSSS